MDESVLKAKTTKKTKDQFKIKCIKEGVTETGLINLLADAFINNPKKTIRELNRLKNEI